MKALVLGHGGMLGRAVVEALEHAGDSVYYDSFANVRDKLSLHKLGGPFDAVINCAGVIPEKHANDLLTILTNSVGPRNVAQVFDCHVVNISTDCVFSGLRVTPYTVHHVPDPLDLYGRSKLLGEVYEPHVTTVRTSFIGTSHGLVPWFLSHPGPKIPGWRNAWWTGSTVWEVARHVVAIARGRPQGIVHLATNLAVTKYDVLMWLKVLYKRDDVDVCQVAGPRIYRNLAPTHMLPPFQSVMRQLVEHSRD